jgi:Tol biopolymer transport system component
LRVRVHAPNNHQPGPGVHRWYTYHLYVMNADGSGLRRLTRNETYTNRQVLWPPDGRTLYFGRYLVRTDGSGAGRFPSIPTTAVWSPDGRRIAFVAKPDWCRTGPRPCYGSHTDIYVMNSDGSGKRKLTHNARYNAEPAWSPDGRKIAFRSTQNGNRDIYVMNADGSGKRNLTRNPARDGSPSWSPDGRRIAFLSDRDGRLEAHVMNADGSGQRSLTQGA